MYQYQFKNGLLRLDSDWTFQSRYLVFTFLNWEYDADPLSKCMSVGLIGFHLTIIWR